MLYFGNGLSQSKTEQNLGFRGDNYVYTEYFWVLSVQVQLESLCRTAEFNILHHWYSFN